MRERITEEGVRRETTRFIGMRLSSWVAWLAVRGKPSRMKEAEGSLDVCGGAVRLARVGVLTKWSSMEISWSWDVAERVRVLAVGGLIQPRVFSSWRMRRRIIASGTREPDFIVLSAFMPGGKLVWFLEVENWGEGSYQGESGS